MQRITYLCFFFFGSFVAELSLPSCSGEKFLCSRNRSPPFPSSASIVSSTPHNSGPGTLSLRLSLEKTRRKTEVMGSVPIRTRWAIGQGWWSKTQQPGSQRSEPGPPQTCIPSMFTQCVCSCVSRYCTAGGQCSFMIYSTSSRSALCGRCKSRRSSSERRRALSYTFSLFDLFQLCRILFPHFWNTGLDDKKTHDKMVILENWSARSLAQGWTRAYRYIWSIAVSLNVAAAVMVVATMILHLELRFVIRRT